jgi:hypothetical protein
VIVVPGSFSDVRLSQDLAPVAAGSPLLTAAVATVPATKRAIIRTYFIGTPVLSTPASSALDRERVA